MASKAVYSCRPGRSVLRSRVGIQSGLDVSCYLLSGAMGLIHTPQILAQVCYRHAKPIDRRDACHLILGRA